MHKPFRVRRTADKRYLVDILAENGRSLCQRVYEDKEQCITFIRALYRLTRSNMSDKAIKDYTDDQTRHYRPRRTIEIGRDTQLAIWVEPIEDDVVPQEESIMQ